MVAELTPSRRGGSRYLAAGGALLAGSAVLSLSDEVTRLEREIFVFVNDWPDWLEAPGWPVMQAGALAMVPLASLVVWVVWRRKRPALALFSSGLTAWVLAKVVKELVDRGRPAELLPAVAVRGNWSGLGFPSGHVAVVFAMATVADAYLPNRWRWAPWLVAGLASLMRMYTGAHLPLDVVGGAGLGLAIGGLVRLLDR
jgi:undecaprenyl-diphosphatase